MFLFNNKKENKIKERKFKVEFNDVLDDKQTLTLENKNKPLSLLFKGRKNKKFNHVTKVSNEDKVLYPSLEEGISLEYEVMDNKVKETLIIENRLDDYCFNFSLNIGDLTPRYNEETECLELLDNDKVIILIKVPKSWNPPHCVKNKKNRIL